MRSTTALALALTFVLFFGAMALRQTQTEPSETPEEPRGAASDEGVFHPIWLVLAGVGFVLFVMLGLLWRRRQRPGAR